jgi:hypothetical protein
LPGRSAQLGTPNAGMDGVPLFPAWTSGLGLRVLAVGGVMALLVVGTLTSNRQGGDALALVVAVALAIVTLLAHSYIRRYKAFRLQERQEIRDGLAVARLGELTWQEFELICIPVLQALGYTCVEKTKNLQWFKAVDIVALNPEGEPVAIECKHWKGKVEVSVLNELIGETTYGPYKGYARILITSSEVTAGVRQAADATGVKVVDRALFLQWLAEAEAEDRMNEELRGSVPETGTGLAGWVRSWAAETKAAVMILAAAFLVVLITVLQVVGAHPDGASPAPQAPVPKASPGAATGVPSRVAEDRSTPGAVAVAYLAAISRHDWPAVWQLGGRNVGQGQSASYAGMVAGEVAPL